MNDLTWYDLSKLKADGSHYVVIGFSIPYSLYLPDGNYEVLMALLDRQITVQVMLESKRRRELDPIPFPGMERGEQYGDRRGIYRYSTVMVYIPTRSTDPDAPNDMNSIWKQVERNHPWFREQAVGAVNRLIEVYRLVSGECHVRSLTGRDVWFDYSFALFFNENPPELSQSRFTGNVMPVTDFHNLVPAVPDLPESVVEDIQKKLLSDFRVPLAEELISNAYDYLDQGKRRLTIVEVETAFEAAVSAFLSDHFQNRYAVKTYSSPYKLIKGKPFQSVMASLGKEFKPGTGMYESWKNNVWFVRGKIVHGKAQDIDHDSAILAITTIETILEYLFDRPRTEPWKYII